MVRRQRRTYSQVSSNEGGRGGSEEEGTFVNEPRASVEETDVTAASRSNNNRSNRLPATGGDGELGVSSSPSDDTKTVATSELKSVATSESSCLLDEECEDDENKITVVILDVAQKKFKVRVSLMAKVETLKLAGHKVHKVSPDRQRLIFRGKLLQDGATLLESGIVDETIVHLFPKPRVVIKDAGEEESKQEDETGSDGEEGARVPTIVLDTEEAERRSQILVLGSQDYLEAQNNVKLFSFMLLIISSIELMNLMFVAAGVPQEEASMNTNNGIVTLDDDIFPRDFNNTGNDDSWNSNSTFHDHGMELTVESWKPRYTFDFIISVMGVYVGILGLQATTHNTLRLAQWYLWGTCVTGAGWMIYNFIETYRIDQEVEAQHEKDPHYTDVLYDNRDLFWQAVTVMVLPGMVWLMCALRAFQFQHLLMEAEMEAQHRIRSEFATVVQAVGHTDEEMGAATPTPNHDEESVFQQEAAQIS